MSGRKGRNTGYLRPRLDYVQEPLSNSPDVPDVKPQVFDQQPLQPQRTQALSAGIAYSSNPYSTTLDRRPVSESFATHGGQAPQSYGTHALSPSFPAPSHQVPAYLDSHWTTRSSSGDQDPFYTMPNMFSHDLAPNGQQISNPYQTSGFGPSHAPRQTPTSEYPGFGPQRTPYAHVTSAPEHFMIAHTAPPQQVPQPLSRQGSAAGSRSGSNHDEEVNPDERRKSQNRRAQRNFRERQNEHRRKLETELHTALCKVRDLEERMQHLLQERAQVAGDTQAKVLQYQAEVRTLQSTLRGLGHDSVERPEGILVLQRSSEPTGTIESLLPPTPPPQASRPPSLKYARGRGSGESDRNYHSGSSARSSAEVRRERSSPQQITDQQAWERINEHRFVQDRRINVSDVFNRLRSLAQREDGRAVYWEADVERVIQEAARGGGDSL